MGIDKERFCIYARDRGFQMQAIAQFYAMSAVTKFLQQCIHLVYSRPIRARGDADKNIFIQHQYITAIHGPRRLNKP
jgi:hypothetical protein